MGHIVDEVGLDIREFLLSEDDIECSQKDHHKENGEGDRGVPDKSEGTDQEDMFIREIKGEFIGPVGHVIGEKDMDKTGYPLIVCRIAWCAVDDRS